MSSQTKSREVQIGVAGCGHWGRNLVRNLHGLGVLRHVCEVHAAARDAVQLQYPEITVSDDYQRMLDDETIDAVVIATPAEQHFWMAEAALRAGKDVFVEKPLALRHSDGEQLVNLAGSL